MRPARKRWLMVLGASGLVLGAGGLAGCAGHGKYTKEGISLAQQRLNALKAASEYDMAHQAFLAGDLDKAMRKTDAALSLTEENPVVHVLRGRIHIERGEMGEALVSLRRAVELDAKSVEGQYYLGVVNERLNEREEALDHFRAAAELDEYNPQYPIAAGETLIDMGKLDEAEAYLNGSPAADSSAGIQQLLGHIAMIDGRVDEACDLFNKARLLAPEDGAILEDQATAQIAAGRCAEAEQNLEHLLRDPDNAGRRDLLHMRAECLMSLNRPVEAREIYRRLTKKDGSADAQAWVGLGRTAYTLEDDKTLREAASRVVSIDPTNADGYVLWAMWHREQGDPKAALAKLDAGLMRAGRDSELLAVRAIVLSELGRRAEALTAAQAALDLDPKSESARTLLDMLGRVAVSSVPVE
ncbi:MAG: tetratricopeptide repeat protein [Phycisphaeraceae bacterium]|nr:MAG: tetratricopeptide repeat protein [Phycisphaeraceae bacterium]